MLGLYSLFAASKTIFFHTMLFYVRSFGFRHTDWYVFCQSEVIIGFPEYDMEIKDLSESVTGPITPVTIVVFLVERRLVERLDS